MSIMKANDNLEARVYDLEKKICNLSKTKNSKIKEGKTVITSILILEKVWKFIEYLFSELEL